MIGKPLQILVMCIGGAAVLAFIAFLVWSALT